MTEPMIDPPIDPPPPPGLVAETTYLDVVMAALTTLELDPVPTEPARAELGLTRLTFKPEVDLDGVLAEIRRRIAAEHGGWTPALGKERDAVSTAMRGGHPKPTSLLVPTKPTDEEAAALVVHPPAPAPGSVRIGVVDTPEVDLTGGGDAWRAHSAFVASIIRAAEPTVDLRSLPALSLDGGKGSAWDVTDAIVTLGFTDEVQILLLPLACFTADGRPPLLLERAIACLPAHVLVIAAAGNQVADPGWSTLGRAPTSAAWPAAVTSVRAVSANFGTAEMPLPATPQPWVDAIAANVEFVGPFFHGSVNVSMPDETEDPQHFDGSAKWRGTSFSAAWAAGLVAARMDENTTALQAWDALLAEGTELRPPGASA